MTNDAIAAQESNNGGRLPQVNDPCSATTSYNEKLRNSSPLISSLAQYIVMAIRSKAQEIGFDRIGFTPALPSERQRAFHQWLEEGRGGTMTYLQRTTEQRSDPRRVLVGARTVVAAGLSYFTGGLSESIRNDPSRGIIAAYAWGEDYHTVLQTKLLELARFIENLAPDIQTGCFADSSPIFEKEYGERAGLGFMGKNTLVIAPRMGSLFFLGEILTTLELPPDPPAEMPSCGLCARCLSACPTNALVEPYVLDARRCISYLTIEHKGIIPRGLRKGMGNHVFGCDECQNCCPWNMRFARETRESRFQAMMERQAMPLREAATMSESDFRKRFTGSSVLRLGWERFLRNTAVAMGNWRCRDAIEPLIRLAQHPSALVRLHVAWSLGRTPGKDARKMLDELAGTDPDEGVRTEAQDILAVNE